MKDNLLIVLGAVAIMWSVLPITIVAQRNVDPCRLFANGTTLRDPDDCSQQIVCIDFESVPGIKCTGSTPFYNKDRFKCDEKLTDHSTCEIDCKNNTLKFVEDPKSCYGYYYCQDEDLAVYGHCPQNFHFNRTQQMCVYDFNSTCGINKLNYCAIVEAGVKFKDESNCGKYNECSKSGAFVQKYCDIAATPYYNATGGECTKVPIEGCHPIPKDICGTTGKSIKKNKFVSDKVTCGGSFYCADFGTVPDPNPQWFKCPDNLFFNEDKNQCMDPLQVICDKDRCEGSKRRFVVSSKSGCRHYLSCENGVKVGEGTCGNTFFDEEHGVCTTELQTYPACYHK